MRERKCKTRQQSCGRRFLLVSILLLLACDLVAEEASACPWQQAEVIVDAIDEPEFPNRTIKFKEKGAAADGTTNDLPALQSLIDDCSRIGGGRIVLESGVYWLEGPIRLQSNINLHLEKDAVLKFSAVPADFLPPVFTRWEGTEMYGYSPFIYAHKSTNIALTGSGTVDGNAASTFATWREKQKEDQLKLRWMGANGIPLKDRIFGKGHWLRPSLLQFIECTNVKIEGVRIIDSPFWCVHPVYCNNVVVRGIDVHSMRLNNDGVDLDSCNHVLIENSTFSTGDDAIAIKSGRDQDGRKKGIPSENIVIRNNRLRKVHNGLTIGSEMSGSVRNVFVENCTFGQGRNLLYFKSNLDRGGVVENIFVRNIDANIALETLIRFQTDYYGYRGGHEPPQFRDFRIEDVTCQEAKQGILVDGHIDAPIKQLVIKGVSIAQADVTITANTHDEVILEDVSINGTYLPLNSTSTESGSNRVRECFSTN